LESRNPADHEEGLAEEAAQSQKVISVSGLNQDHMRIESAILDSLPSQVVFSPFIHEGKTVGVVEMGRLNKFEEQDIDFLKTSMETIAISVHSAISRKKITELLNETQVQTGELQLQQEELRQMNEELEEQTQNLKQQQEELQMTNEELEQQAKSLELKNTEVESARDDIARKKKQLEISSKYKSEFLANMSHELRTPLNSLLILSKDLADNKKQNLDSIQVECAEIIYKSGHDLLILINEVLDLSKIEAGKMTLNIAPINLQDFVSDVLRNFKHVAEGKGLELIAHLDQQLPETIWSDPQRLNQILKNLLSNAIKFTDKGSVIFAIKQDSYGHVLISVSDTGIGIPENKHEAVFEAFQQADGGTSRKYGGTGLGLSISRELAGLLGGSIEMKSKEHEGSEFTLVIPVKLIAMKEEQSLSSTYLSDSANETISQTSFLNYPTIADDRNSLVSGDHVVLIIEDDLKFASILLRLANEKGFRCITASTGEDGLLMATKFNPVAIILDMDLPGMQGKGVLRRLKDNPAMRHIPVHIISARSMTMQPLLDGAVSYLVKPVEKHQLEHAFNRIEQFVKRKIKHLLIIEDNDNSRKAMKLLVCSDNVNCMEASTGKEALEIFKEQPIDCIILDLGLPDISGFDLIRQLEREDKSALPPIIIYTGRELTREENAELEKYAQSIIIKGVKSEERLIDETSLFLHHALSNLPKSEPEKVFNKEAIFEGKTILLAEDDMRNVFALKLVLNQYGMEVLRAENGREALTMLEENPAIHLVLMDIMMPEMDGYEAMKHIRARQKYRNLPILALTAKAMKDDKQKCIDAGANDYVTKPIDLEQLLSLMRVWLSK
jgi:signal transduction histidine kinase/DNA-binding response OmpR family regulator